MFKFFFKHRCYNGGKQHKFEPRYSERLNDRGIKGSWITSEDFRRLIYFNVYEKDVCVWCGKEVKNTN